LYANIKQPLFTPNYPSHQRLSNKAEFEKQQILVKASSAGKMNALVLSGFFKDFPGERFLASEARKNTKIIH
jgi:hypothetical protein